MMTTFSFLVFIASDEGTTKGIETKTKLRNLVKGTTHRRINSEATLTIIHSLRTLDSLHHIETGRTELQFICHFFLKHLLNGQMLTPTRLQSCVLCSR